MKVLLKKENNSSCCSKHACISITNQVFQYPFSIHEIMGEIPDEIPIKTMEKDDYTKILFPNGVNENWDQHFVEVTAHVHMVHVLSDEEVLVFDILDS